MERMKKDPIGECKEAWEDMAMCNGGRKKSPPLTRGAKCGKRLPGAPVVESPPKSKPEVKCTRKGINRRRH